MVNIVVYVHERSYRLLLYVFERALKNRWLLTGPKPVSGGAEYTISFTLTSTGFSYAYYQSTRFVAVQACRFLRRNFSGNETACRRALYLPLNLYVYNARALGPG